MWADECLHQRRQILEVWTPRRQETVQFISFQFSSVQFSSAQLSSQLTMEQPRPHVGSCCTERRNYVLHRERQPPNTPLSCCLPQHLTQCKQTYSSLAAHGMLRPNHAEFKKLITVVLLYWCNCLSLCYKYMFISPLASWFNVAWCSHQFLCKPSVHL